MLNDQNTRTVIISGKAELDFDDSHGLLDDVIIGDYGSILSVLSHLDVCDGDEVEMLIVIKKAKK